MFGARVAGVWRGLRPATRSLVESALGRATGAGVTTPTSQRTGRPAYDVSAEWELSRLLAALDERAAERGGEALTVEQARELGRVAATCAHVLHAEARSAEVFGQLLVRALRANDYKQVDELADALSSRLVPSEACELARHTHPAVRALAQEALLQAPASVLINLLADPVDAEVARDALVRQAVEFDSEEARWVVSALEEAEAEEDL